MENCQFNSTISQINVHFSGNIKYCYFNRIRVGSDMDWTCWDNCRFENCIMTNNASNSELLSNYNTYRSCEFSLSDELIINGNLNSFNSCKIISSENITINGIGNIISFSFINGEKNNISNNSMSFGMYNKVSFNQLTYL